MPVPVVSSNNVYYLAQRFNEEILPLILREELSFAQKSYQTTPLFTTLFPFVHVDRFSLRLVPLAEEKQIIEMMPSTWFDLYAPWVSLFDKVVERAYQETMESKATYFSLDMFAAHIWFSDLPECYCGLGLSARLQTYVRKDLWM